MFREFKTNKALINGRCRRWFWDDYFDLFIWETADGRIVSFHLSYDTQARERILSWDEKRGFSHGLVDGGEDNPQSNHSPMLKPGGTFPYQEVVLRFEKSSPGLDHGVAALILEKLHLYNTATQN